MSGVLEGCMAARTMVDIREMACPRCGNAVEFFVRDGSLAEDVVCENCGYLVAEARESEGTLSHMTESQM